MNISSFFIERPIFASVIALIMVMIGAIAVTLLPVAQFPPIAPPAPQLRRQALAR